MILISVNNSLSYSLSAIISIKSFGEEFTSCITVLVCYQYINLCSSLSAVFPLLTLNLAHISCNDAPRWTTAFPILYNSFHLGYGQKARSDVGHIKEGFLFYLQNHECESLYSQARLTLLNSITSSASCVCLLPPKSWSFRANLEISGLSLYNFGWKIFRNGDMCYIFWFSILLLICVSIFFLDHVNHSIWSISVPLNKQLQICTVSAGC